MKSKKSKKNKNNQEFFDFPDYEKVTPEIEKTIHQIKNPFIFSYILAILSLIVGIYLLIISRTNVSTLLRIYYLVFGIGGIGFCVGEIFFTLKKNIAFNKFLKRKEYRIIWIYSDKKYQEFYQGLKDNNEGASQTRMLFLLGAIVILTILLFFTMPPETRYTGVVFGIICFGVIFITGYLIPRSYIMAAKRKPYISLISDNAAYAIGRFYQWEKAYIKFRVLSDAYGIDATEMRISYQEMSIFGKKTPTFQVLIPNNEKYTLMYARRVAKRINKTRKMLNANPTSNDDFMDKAFKRLIGNENE